MTRVLHLITRYLDGGAETTTANTLTALAEAETEYDLRLGTGAEHDPSRLRSLEERGYGTVVFRSMRHYNPVSAVVAVFAVAWYLHCEDIDVIHTHSTEAGVIGRFAGWLARTPVVVHEIHGDPITADRNPLLNQALLVLERLSAPLADRLIVKAERIRETFLDRGIGRREQYELIYHGVDIARFRDIPDVAPADDGPVRLLFVGRLEDGKGLFDLLDAVERLEEVRLDIAGDGPLYNDLQTAVSDRDLNVTLLGYRDDIPQLMSRADVFVLPSYREGTPRVITEAMAAGLPVVATDIAGIPDQVTDGKTGVLVTPGDVDELTRVLRELISDPHRRGRYGALAQEHVNEFAVETAAERYRDLYRQLSQR